MLSNASVLPTLCVHMHVLLREKTYFHVSGCCETSPGLGRVALQLACPTCHTTCLPLCGVFATHEHPFKHARTQRGPKKKHIVRLQHPHNCNAKKCSACFRFVSAPRSRQEARADGTARIGIELAPAGTGTPANNRPPRTGCGNRDRTRVELLTVSCLCPLSVLLHLLLACTACFKHATKRANAQDWDPALRLHLSNMPHRRWRCQSQTCHKQGSHTLNENLLERAPTTPHTVFANIMRVYLYI